MPAQIPTSVEEALSKPASRPAPSMPTLAVIVVLWLAAAAGLHAVVYPAAPQKVATGPALPGLTLANSLTLTDEVARALLADQVGSILLKINLAQKVAQQLEEGQPQPPPPTPATPATAP